MGLYDNSDIIIDDVNYSWKGDFLGFTIGNIHSSSLGIVRVSDGDRYSEELTPTFTDRTATVSGLDETYYFGTDYTQKVFNIKFAFDHLTETQMRTLKQIFSKKEPQNLIFDETPYKVYSVKVNGQPKLSYLCFEENYNRIYKGDGEVNFIAYSPFAKSRFKYKEDYNVKNIPEWGGIEDNKMDWLKSSGMIKKDSILGGNYLHGNKLDKYDSSCRIQLFNPGDREAQCQILCNVSDFYSQGDFGFLKNFPIFALIKNKPSDFSWNNIKNKALGYLVLDKDKINDKVEKDNLKSIMIDSRKKLIYGSSVPIKDTTGETTTPETFLLTANKKIYNNCIYCGNFFDIPQTTKDDSLLIGVLNPPKNPETSTKDNVLIYYNYLYY